MMEEILRKAGRPWRLALATSVLVLLSGTANAQVSVYHSANDDGTNTGVNVPGSTTHPLNLYITKGNTASGGQVCLAGNGDEICGWIFELGTVGNFSFVDFTPEPGVDLVFKLTANNFDAQGTDALAPTPGIHRIGTLNIDTQGFGGSIQLTGGQAVAANLQVETIAPGAIAVPEPSAELLLVTGGLLLAIMVERRQRI